MKATGESLEERFPEADWEQEPLDECPKCDGTVEVLLAEDDGVEFRVAERCEHGCYLTEF